MADPTLSDEDKAQKKTVVMDKVSDYFHELSLNNYCFSTVFFNFAGSRNL